MALTAEEIADLVVSTQRDLGRMKITEIATDLQEHVAMSRLMRRNRVGFDGGIAIQWNVLLNADNNSRNVGLFDVDNVNQEDGMKSVTVPWRHTVSAHTFDRRQLSMNKGDKKVLDFVKGKRYQQLIALTALMEQNFWDEPESSTDDTTPFGLKYWLVYNATEGFNGGNNTNFAAGPAGLNRTTYPRWRNYTFQYTNVTVDDLIRKMRRASAMCNFRPVIDNPPIPGYGTNGGNGGNYAYYTTYDVLTELEDRAADQNDALGNDVASMDGRTLFRRTPISWVPWLQANEATADPVVGINWSVFKIIFLEGEYLREDPPEKAPFQHNVMQAFLDCTYNFTCYDCRRLFLGAKSTWHH